MCSSLYFLFVISPRMCCPAEEEKKRKTEEKRTDKLECTAFLLHFQFHHFFSLLLISILHDGNTRLAPLNLALLSASSWRLPEPAIG